MSEQTVLADISGTLTRLTLTAMMYAIVAKVVSPARSSVEKFASGISSGYKTHCDALAHSLENSPLGEQQGQRSNVRDRCLEV